MSNHKPTARRRRPQASNPFAGRDNFPSWEEVLGETECEQPTPSPSPSPPPADLDISFFSQASSLNMSIGARAALNEHLRHVQKYGLDTSTLQIDAQQHATNPLDEEWDRLVESRDSPHNVNNSSSLEDTILHESATSEVGHESIEVMTNVSIDYFNSSRVNLLRTPTKNRSRRFNAVSTRGGETSYNQSSLLDDDDDDESDSGESATMLRMLAGVGLSPRKLTPPDQSFASFSALDISRISADGIEGGGGLRRSPDCSFQDHRSTIDEPLHQSFLSHMEMAPGRDFRNTSGVLSPRRSPPRSEPQRRRSPPRSEPLRRRSPPRSDTLRRSPPRSDTLRRNLRDYTTPKRGRRQSSAIRVSKEKENAPTDDYFKDMIGLSPIGCRIGDPSSKIPHPSQQPNISFSTIEEGAPSFLHNIDETAATSLFHNIGDPSGNSKISDPSHPNTSFSTIEGGAPSFLHNVDEAAATSLFHNIGDPSGNSKISHPSHPNTSFSTIEEGATSFLHNVGEAEEYAPSFLQNAKEAAASFLFPNIGDSSRNSKISHPSQQPNTSFSTIEEGAPSFLLNTDEDAAPSLFHNINEASQTQEITESPNDLSAGRVSVVEYNRNHDSEISTLNSSSAGKKKGSGSIHFSPGSPLDLQDRRRYRTVVPSRVFMSTTDDIPEQYDSFSGPFSAPAPRTNALLDSFDAAVYRSGYSDPT
jgi:hypothetical protein